MSRRVVLPLVLNIGALAVVAAAAWFLFQPLGDGGDSGDDGGVVAPPGPSGTGGGSAGDGENGDGGNGSAAGSNGSNGDSDSDGSDTDTVDSGFDPLLPRLPADEHSTVTRCGFFLYHEDQAADVFQQLITDFDCRAVASLREVPYRSLEHRELLDNAARILADKPYRDGGTLRFPGLLVNPDLRRIVVEAEALEPDDALEFLICTPRGKSHESLFMLTPTARQLALALHLIDCDPCSADQRPMVEGDWALWDGDTVRISAEWYLGRTHIERRIEELVATDDGSRLPDTGWVFTGAPAAVAGETLMADSVGPVAALWSSPFAILTNPWPGARNDSGYRPSDLHPKPGTPVRLTLVPEPAAARHARLDELQDEWEAFAERREQLLDEAGARALADGVTRRDAEQLIAGPDPDGGDNGDGEGEPDDMARYALPPLVPALTDEEIRDFNRLVGQLSGAESIKKLAYDKLCALDSRYERLAEEVWRTLRSDPDRAELLSSAIDRMAYQPFEKDGIVYYSGMAVDPERRMVIADAVVAPFENMPLEFLVCGPRGKGHESIFLLSPHARNLEASFERLGYEASSQQPTHLGDWRLYDGDTVIIEAAWLTEDLAKRPAKLAGPEAWRDQPGITCKRVEELVIDRFTNRPLPPTGFAFTGSYFIGQGERQAFAADEAGAIVGALTVPQSVLENPWPRAGREHAYVADRRHIPDTHRPVRLFFYLEPESERAKRLPELKAAWEDQKLKRPRMEFDAPPGWKKIGARTDFVYVNEEEASIAVMVEGKYTAEKAITRGYKEFVFDKTGFDSDFKDFVGPYTPHGARIPGVYEEPWRTLARRWNRYGIDTTHGQTDHGGHPMWRFVWVDKNDQPVFRAVVMTSRFYYHVFAFWPGRTDIDALEPRFLALLDRLELGHDENHISVGQGWSAAKELDPKHEEMVGDWKVDLEQTIRRDPANAEKGEDELRQLIREAEAERLHEAVVAFTADRLDIFQPNKPQVSWNYSVTTIDGNTVNVDLIDRRGHLSETSLTVGNGIMVGTFGDRYLVLRKAE